jgi:adenine-specific DNA methylase
VTGRSDTRLIDYGYQSYHDLFNARQLLHLALLRSEIAKLPPRYQVPCAIAFSNHLTTNCMLTAYAFGWRRLSPLFSIRAFRHVPRPVEINPWADGTGRGTFPNAVHRVASAVAFAVSPSEADRTGGFRATPAIAAHESPVVRQVPASRLHHIATGSVDIVLTDPPYFDNIAYSELSAFFRPWMETLGLIPKIKGQDYIVKHELRGARAQPEKLDFEERLSTCFQEIARVLRAEGRLVFTFQHSTATAWHALARSLASAQLEPLQVFPMLGNGDVGLQSHPGSATWDAVLVFRKRANGRASINSLRLNDAVLQKAQQHVRQMERKITAALPGRFRAADRLNLSRAAYVAASLGLFGLGTSAGHELLMALQQETLAPPFSPPKVAHATAR